MVAGESVRATGSTLTHLEGALSGQTYPANDRPLLARYDLDKAARILSRESLARRRTGGIWRWFELLPVREREHVVYLQQRAKRMNLPASASALQPVSIWAKALLSC